MKHFYIGFGALIIAAGLGACSGGGGGSGLTVPIGPIGPSPNAATYTGSERIATVYNNYPPPAVDPNVTPYPNTNVTNTMSDNVSSVAGSNSIVTSETISEPNETIKASLTTLVSSAPNGGVTNLTVASSIYSDTNGYVQKVTYPSGAGLIVDQSPETNGASWTNNAQRTLAETYSDGTDINRSTNADGSYVETQVDNGTSINDTATVNSDASASWLAAPGSYGFYGGYFTGFTATAPSGGNVTFKATNYLGGTQQLTVPVFFSTSPVSLASSNSTIATGVMFPGSCSVPSAYGTTGNDVHSVTSSVDPIFGFIETTTTDAYTTAAAGAVCIAMTDVLATYYDWNGDEYYFVYLSSVPLIRTTTTTTLTLQSGSGIGVTSTGSRNAQSATANSTSSALSAKIVAAVQYIFRGEAIRLRALAQRRVLNALRARVMKGGHL